MENEELTELIMTGKNNEALTTSKFNTYRTSLEVAKEFGKKHKHVLESIENIMVQDKQGSSKRFLKGTYKVKNSLRSYPMYYLSYSGYQYLKNKYTTRKKSTKSNYLYIVKQIGLDDYYKIGITHSIKKRLKQFENVAPIGIELVGSYKTDKALELETELHNTYEASNSNLEWYHLTQEQLKQVCFYIEQNINNEKFV